MSRHDVLVHADWVRGPPRLMCGAPEQDTLPTPEFPTEETVASDLDGERG